MNTPAHAMLNLALLGRKDHPERALPILLGSILPDVPIFLFYVWVRFVQGRPDALIWTQIYFQPGWQALFDLFHSLPLILAGLAVAWRSGSRWWTALLAGMALHVPEDFFLHNEDAHRHFYPFWDWRFRSPVSYWDPSHYGRIAAPIEAAVVLVCCGLLLARYRALWVRLVVGGVMLVYTLFLGLAFWV
jgi:hypothetical protein